MAGGVASWRYSDDYERSGTRGDAAAHSTVPGPTSPITPVRNSGELCCNGNRLLVGNRQDERGGPLLSGKSPHGASRSGPLNVARLGKAYGCFPWSFIERAIGGCAKERSSGVRPRAAL